eukprot:10803067-Lingulodinium_polyedra.AAC.1
MAAEGYQLNDGKTVNIPVMKGPGSTSSSRSWIQGGATKVGRYLGPMLDANGSASFEVRVRCRQAAAAWSMVSDRGTLFSGMEGFVLEDHHYRSFDRVLHRLFRRLSKGKARGKTNQW